MTDRPIIFSGPMIRALLAGSKTQTRRILKPQPICSAGPIPSFSWGRFGGLYPDDWFGYGNPVDGALPYQPANRLWVREACAGWMAKPSLPGIGGTVRPSSLTYRADETSEEWQDLLHDRRMIRLAHGDRQDPSGNWVVYSPIHMPRWASRLTLTVTDVRVQRLQEIGEEDAIAEGCPTRSTEALAGQDPRGWFRDLWDGLHGPEAWAANPWVAAVSFTVERRNIDA